jgi:hypothetical protein
VKAPDPTSRVQLPLLNPRWKFAVLWSRKSACTATLIWFINTLGRSAEARASGLRPHNWRVQVHQRSQEWRDSMQAFRRGGWKVLRVIRDPYARAISIYRHVLRDRLEADRIASFLGRDLRQGYSFTEFLSFLDSRDLQSLNPHVWTQKTALEEEVHPDRVVNISKADLFAELNTFERYLGIPVTDFETLTWLKEFETPRQVTRIAFDGDVSGVPLTRIFAEDQREWPANEAFLNDETRRMIEKIYEVDFLAYRDFL